MKRLILPVVTGWQEKGGAQAPRVWSRPYACVGVGKRVDMLLCRRFKWDQSAVCGECSLGCGTSLQTPEFRSISASPPKLFLSIPLFLLYQPFTVVSNTSLGELKPQGLSEGRAANGRFSKFTLSPWFLPWIQIEPLTITATSAWQLYCCS